MIRAFLIAGGARCECDAETTSRRPPRQRTANTYKAAADAAGHDPVGQVRLRSGASAHGLSAERAKHLGWRCCTTHRTRLRRRFRDSSPSGQMEQT